MYLGLFSCKIFVTGYNFWKSYVLMVVLRSFVMLFERSSKLYLLRGKIIASLPV